MDPQAAAAQTAEAAAAALHAATAAAAAAQETAAQRAATAELQAATAELQAASGTAAQEAAAAAQAATAAAQRTAAAQESLKAEVRQMVAAQLAQARSAPAPAPRAPKLPPPEIFTGASSERGNVDQWLFLVETYLTTNGFVDPKVQVATAAAYLRGPALAWWRNCVQTDTKPATLAEFGITLKANFQPINSIEAARDRLANMRQTGSFPPRGAVTGAWGKERNGMAGKAVEAGLQEVSLDAPQEDAAGGKGKKKKKLVLLGMQNRRY